MSSVLQPWVEALPLRAQGTLLTGVRGSDLEPKDWIALGLPYSHEEVVDSPARRLTAYIRWCFMNPADPREVDIPGAFFQSQPPHPFHPSAFGHMPLHWYTHAMHALEVIGYCHPEGWIADEALGLYKAMVAGLHLSVEIYAEMDLRLREDRIEAGTVVS